MQADGLEVLADAGRGEHPPVADQRHTVDAEAPADLVHLAGERGRIGPNGRIRSQLLSANPEMTPSWQS